MSTGYSRSPKLLKGALVEFSSRIIGPVPNVIMFQYNPETLSRKIDVWGPDTGGHGGANEQSSAAKSQSRAQPMDPTETFTLNLVMDAIDAMENPLVNPIEFASGIADRIAALEMLLYPANEGLFSGLLGDVGGSLSGAIGGNPLAKKDAPVPRQTVPVVLFVWGASRIVPVRLTSFSVDEQDFSPLLFPIRAKVTIGLKILTPEDFGSNPNTIEKLAIACFKYTKKQKEALAIANVANDVQSILGMLPF